MVPKAISPASARVRRPGTLSRAQASFGAGNRASTRSPVCSGTTALTPAATSASVRASARRSSAASASSIGWPVARSQRTNVSRWLAMPMAASAPASVRARTSAIRAVASTEVQISSGS